MSATIEGRDTVTVKTRYQLSLDRVALILASVATVGIVFDAVATYLAVEVFRVGQELNPVILWMAAESNFAIAMVFRVIGGVALILIFMLLIRLIKTHREKVLSVYALGLAALMLTLLTCWHVYIIVTQLSAITDSLT